MSKQFIIIKIAFLPIIRIEQYEILVILLNKTINMNKILLFTSITAFCSISLIAQSYYPYNENGFYTLNGSYEPANRIVVDKSGNHIGSNGFVWSNFNETYYSNSALVTDIVYLVKNNSLAAVGQLVNGKKSGLWVGVITDRNNENFGKIKEISIYDKGVLKKRKLKDLTYSDESCYDMGFFNLNAASQTAGKLYDINGVPTTNEEFEYDRGFYTSSRLPFNGIAYLNESGVCYYDISTYKNGFPNGLSINSNEGGYVYSFGEMLANKKVGMWMHNEYTGEAHDYTKFNEDAPIGYSLIFKENQYVGRAEYNSNGELIECIGNCE